MTTEAIVPLSKIVVPSAIFRRGPLVTRDGYLLTAEDRAEISGLPALFEWAFCSGDHQSLLSLLTDDIVIDHALGYANGKAEMANLKIPSFGLRHQLTNAAVFINDEGEASCVSYLNAPQVVTEKPVAVNLPAIYANCVVVDTFRRDERGVWQFSKRIFDQLKLADYLNIDDRTKKRIALPSAEAHAQKGQE